MHVFFWIFAREVFEPLQHLLLMEEEIETWESRASSSGSQLKLTVLGELCSKESLAKAQVGATTLHYHSLQTNSSLSLISARILTLEAEHAVLSSINSSFYPLAHHVLPSLPLGPPTYLGMDAASRGKKEEAVSKRQEEAGLRGMLESKESTLALQQRQLTEFQQRTERVTTATKAFDSASLGVSSDTASLSSL